MAHFKKIAIIRNFLALPIISGALLTGCDCMQKAQGIVLEKETNNPVDSVIVSTVDIEKNSYPGYSESTDKNGRFNFVRISGGAFKCPDLALYFYKKGYETTKITFAPGTMNDTILLLRKKSEQ